MAAKNSKNFDEFFKNFRLVPQKRVTAYTKTCRRGPAVLFVRSNGGEPETVSTRSLSPQPFTSTSTHKTKKLGNIGIRNFPDINKVRPVFICFVAFNI